jgi:3-hydroxybutyryl-CoA dehydrogenase
MTTMDETRNPRNIAVLGAGVMGSDIALQLASSGYPVILKDIRKNALDASEKRITDGFRLMKMMKKVDPLSSEEVLSRIEFATEYDGFDKIELVIENITENYDTKKALYKELREFCKENVIYGVNTSCIPITRIGALMPRPENVIGMHFMNPVHMSSLVEVVQGYHTSQETLDITKTFIARLGKTSVVVHDFPGFVTNRVLMLTINECVWLVQDQVSKPSDIDKIFRLGIGHKMGPLATADLIGLDTVLNSLIVLFESYNDPKFRPCPLLRRMVDAGLLGKKTGKGFFEYGVS